jgi:hypothetical protein
MAPDETFLVLLPYLAGAGVAWFVRSMVVAWRNGQDAPRQQSG